MYKTQHILLTALFIISPLTANALGINGNPVNTTPEAKDDYISVVVRTFTSATGNVGINDRYGDFFTLDESWVGKYGAITSFSSDGEFSYELFDDTDSDSLPSGGVGTEHFTYTYGNDKGYTDTATLNIQVHENRVALPKAKDDYNSVVVDVLPTAAGFVGDNDLYGDNFSLNDSRTGKYGALISFTATGQYIYQLFDSTNADTLPEDGAATDSFKYTYNNAVGGSDTATLFIDITANPVKPIAKDDYNSAIVGVSPEVIGNVGDNDLYGDTFFLKTSKTGEYGSLSFTANGAYIYTLYDSTNSSTLPENEVAIDSFEYTYANASGLSDTASLIIDVSANPSQPIAKDDFDSTVVKLSPTATGNVGVNDRFGSIFTLKGSKSGQYGLLNTFSATGAYTYELYDSTNNNNLPLTAQATDRFQYTYEDEAGASDTAWLSIDVNANQQLAPIANDDHISTVVAVYTEATGSVANNDYYGTSYSLDVTWLGQYGAITSFDSQGEYSYELFESTDATNLPATGIGIDSFTYTYWNEEGLNDTARIIIDVRANPTQPIANDDYISVVIGVFVGAEGEVSTNDRYGDKFSLDQSWVGKYGAITSFDSAGKYTYALFDSTNNESLPAGSVSDIERFQYTYINDKGFTDTAWIIIDVQVDPGKSQSPIAINDQVSVVITVFPTATGNVISNDRNGSIVTFDGSSRGKYGFLTAEGTSGAFSYVLFDSVQNSDLPVSGVDNDTFTYTLKNESGDIARAVLTIDVSADPSLSGGSESPLARNDNITAISNKSSIVTGNVTSNDSNGDYVVLLAPTSANPNSPTTKYGLLVLEATGVYTYEIYETAPDVIALKAGEVVNDTFIYEYFSNSGESAIAELIVQIIGNPIDGNGDTIFENPDDKPYDNVDVELNDDSTRATPLNSARNIQGHLHSSSDKDWYVLESAGDEIITLEVCPKGTSCFDKKSWVLYVFDSDFMTPQVPRLPLRHPGFNAVLDPSLNPNFPDPAPVPPVVDPTDGVAISIEESVYPFKRFLNDTGTIFDEVGAGIINGIVGRSSHMYLKYRLGGFEVPVILKDTSGNDIIDPVTGLPVKGLPLIGIVDPCFDSLNSVDIGVKPLPAGSPPKKYFIAISSPLLGSGNDGEDGKCGAGSVILQNTEAGAALGTDGRTGDPKSYIYTEEFITVFPNSDDQYAIKITSTGLDPLQSNAAVARSSSFDSSTGTLTIPRVRVNDDVFSATLSLQNPNARSKDNVLKFVLSDMGALSFEEMLDSYRATYNPENQQILIPRVTDTATDLAFSVVMKLHIEAEGELWFEVVSLTQIK